MLAAGAGRELGLLAGCACQSLLLVMEPRGAFAEAILEKEKNEMKLRLTS
jgi:hypothetical protein